MARRANRRKKMGRKGVTCEVCGRRAVYITWKNREPRCDKEHTLCWKCELALHCIHWTAKDERP